ncbi:dihydrofolate reductase [Dyadobacter jejuensis]|uniref:Dihydrofolate reductase n=1 Tax=Dyadobacter jejuensis TaxID=1082580 RepID=A0A316AR33_9BACT|nr:dihydrofolate reductase [Dyadobacter jejuensis]PWJ60185.1 dihydrofolate reductase [Dyadobacter jejuensis]
MTPKISIIAAMSENHVIGRNNQLPWHLPDEWENFRKITDGKAFVMGRKSYEAPDALHSTYKNVVLSRQQTEFSGAIRTDNLERALGILHDEEEVFILGGASVFKEAILLADILYLTVVHAQLDGDAFFPEVGRDLWRLGTSVYHGADQSHEYAFSMNIFTRKQ